jgi:hypothetical protein
MTGPPKTLLSEHSTPRIQIEQGVCFLEQFAPPNRACENHAWVRSVAKCDRLRHQTSGPWDIRGRKTSALETAQRTVRAQAAAARKSHATSARTHGVAQQCGRTCNTLLFAARQIVAPTRDLWVAISLREQAQFLEPTAWTGRAVVRAPAVELLAAVGARPKAR